MKQSILRLVFALGSFFLAIIALYFSVFCGWASLTADDRTEIERLELSSELAFAVAFCALGISIFVACKAYRDFRVPLEHINVG